MPYVDYGKLQLAIEKTLDSFNLQRVPTFITKVRILFSSFIYLYHQFVSVCVLFAITHCLYLCLFPLYLYYSLCLDVCIYLTLSYPPSPQLVSPTHKHTLSLHTLTPPPTPIIPTGHPSTRNTASQTRYDGSG